MRNTCVNLGSVRQIVAVVAVAVCCLVACGSDPLDECLESLDPVGHFDCSYQDFTGVDLSGRNLRQANLRNAVLKGADLSGANLDQAYFGAASLLEADLTGARLTGERLEHADLWEAKADRDTVWPEGFDPVAAGVIFD